MDTFCVLPWYSVELPGYSPCCLLPKNTDINQLKNDLLAGIKSQACSKCWNIESDGNQSRRQLENQFLDYKLNRDLNKIRNDCQDNKNTALLYQITTSNLCNQACVSCNSGSSTKWAEIEGKMGKTTKSHHVRHFSAISINYNTAKRISLLGGEPFFDPTTFEILEQLIDHGNVDCFISLITNGSIKLKPEQSDLLAKFKNLNICVSIDGIGPVFEYLRWPGRWNTLIDNLKQYHIITKNISISYTISSLNAMYYDQTIEWFKNNNFRYNHNVVSFPAWLSLENMPVEFKNQLSKNKNFISNYCNINGKEITINQMHSEISKQDRAKKINIYNYMPQVANLLSIG
jgi:MoaA/NifB/PqqE/SkfB family radical SAM enzyme